MRLFIAINFNDDTKKGLITLCEELRSHCESGRFSAPENLHLTLAFLGECDKKQTSAVKAVMDEIKFEPFPITIECVGRFRRDGGDIFWVGVQESKPLAQLQSDFADKLITAGFTLDKRKFNPHITLGREIITNVAPWTVEPFGEIVTSIELMKSERINGKLTYSAIYEKKT